MKKSFLSLIFALVGFGALTTSCEDMLTPNIDRYAENFSGKDTVNFYFGILRNLQGVVEQNILLGELRGDLVTPTEFTSDSINNIINFGDLSDGSSRLLNRAAYYKVINQCNFYLAKADSMALRNNTYFMRRELAQVQLVRAWTYLQLVQQYGKVPFIVEPVTNANTGWETNPPHGIVDADNLLEKLEKDGGLKQAYAYSRALGYINYPNFKTGSRDFSQALTVFNGDLIYGDLYLLRGKGTQDYEKAATHYHTFLDIYTKQTVTAVAKGFPIDQGREGKYSGESKWSSIFSQTENVGEMVTAMPSAANNSFGQVLTRIPEIYGFATESTSARTTGKQTNASGKTEEVTTASGSISVKADERHRQVAPSNAYLSLNQNQVFVYTTFEDARGEKVKELKYPALGDLRASLSAPMVKTEEGNKMRFIHKFSPSFVNSIDAVVNPRAFSFNYGIPLYRVRTILLKYAEAINRAGYPRMAFDVLRSGLTLNSVPRIVEDFKDDSTFTDNTKADLSTITVSITPALAATRHGANSIDLSTLQRAKGKPYLNFSTINRNIVGIHEAGCGPMTDADTVWVYNKVVAQRIVDEAARQGKTIPLPKLSTKVEMVEDSVPSPLKRTTATGDDYEFKRVFYKFTPLVPSEEEIAAVETIIADEMALESAFEGTRFFDLMRIQRHRNLAKDEVAENSWLAWLVSRRDLKLKPYEQPTLTGNLYGKLLTPSNWYLPAPQKRN